MILIHPINAVHFNLIVLFLIIVSHQLHCERTFVFFLCTFCCKVSPKLSKRKSCISLSQVRSSRVKRLKHYIMDSGMNSVSNQRLGNLFFACPEELLLKIFGFLDTKSIKELILVNKR